MSMAKSDSGTTGSAVERVPSEETVIIPREYKAANIELLRATMLATCKEQAAIS